MDHDVSRRKFLGVALAGGVTILAGGLPRLVTAAAATKSTFQLGGDVTVETNRGDINLTGGSGVITLKSIQGEVTVQKAKGRIEVRSVNEGIHLADLNARPGQIWV